MKQTLLILAMATVLFSCSSSKTTGPIHSIERDYVVKDASSGIRPEWLEDVDIWAKDDGDLKLFRYFAFETTPKVDREIACDLAKANARTDIATEIATFIEKSLGFSKEGAASIGENDPHMQELREFVEVTLAEKTKALIHGASVQKVYWEKRYYKKNLGARKDFVGYTCGALIRIDKEQLKKAVDEAAMHVVKRADDPQTKANVKKALKDASENFDKAKQGL